jgi:hypothetical protein
MLEAGEPRLEELLKRQGRLAVHGRATCRDDFNARRMLFQLFPCAAAELQAVDLLAFLGT